MKRSRFVHPPVAWPMAAIVLATCVGMARGADDAVEIIALTEGYRPYLEKAPVLWEQGGQVFAARDGWIALAAGRAPLEDRQGRPVDPAEARKVAEIHAHRELEKALHGALRSSSETSRVQSIAGGGVREEFRSFSGEKIDAVVSGAEVAGCWYRERRRHLVVLVVAGTADRPRAAASASAGTAFRKVEIQPQWRKAFGSRRGILTGGAALYRDGDAVLVLVVGRADLGDPATAAKPSIVARATASSEALKFLQGLRIRACREARAEMIRLTEDEKTIFEDYRETFRSTASERTTGAAPPLQAVGRWESADGRWHYEGFVFSILPSAIDANNSPQ